MAIKFPAHIKGTGHKWLKKIIAEYDFTETDLAMVFMAAESLNRIEEARVQIDRDGLTIPDRFGILRQHPAHAIERDNRMVFIRLTSRLGISGKLKDLERHNKDPFNEFANI